ncbi:hypothetical protein MKW94_023522 [Papaver nudicaule]|uniref:Uncharacterized protein n=1 Tax=Papaver nudicaule TaxID=74823 RepID=A0AA42B405_PAPNU|nr:hypothetical protein [Papaver nudicaule]
MKGSYKSLIRLTAMVLIAGIMFSGQISAKPESYEACFGRCYLHCIDQKPGEQVHRTYCINSCDAKCKGKQAPDRRGKNLANKN